MHSQSASGLGLPTAEESLSRLVFGSDLLRIYCLLVWRSVKKGHVLYHATDLQESTYVPTRLFQRSEQEEGHINFKRVSACPEAFNFRLLSSGMRLQGFNHNHALNTSGRLHKAPMHDIAIIYHNTLPDIPKPETPKALNRRNGNLLARKPNPKLQIPYSTLR